MPVVIAIDAGTTGVRALAIDEAARTVGLAYREFTQYFPQPGWVEHDATEIASVIREVLLELTASLTEPVATVGMEPQCLRAPPPGHRLAGPPHRRSL